MAAAVLADLRRRGRIEVEPGTVRILDSTPVGDRFLDSVLDRLSGGGAHLAYEWLRLIGPGVHDNVVRRLYAADLLSAAGLTPGGLDAARRLRATLTQTISAGEPDGGPPLLGALLWAWMRPVGHSASRRSGRVSGWAGWPRRIR